MRPTPIIPGPGQESVWDYPRPPRLEPVSDHVEIVFGGVTIAATDAAYRVLETSHPPTYYLPMDCFVPGTLQSASGSSVCEWKGRAVYYDVVSAGTVASRVAWGYPEPTPAFVALTDHVAVYAAPMDACSVGGELVEPQPGGFYGGWVTRAVVGPFKGGPGSMGW